MRTWAHRAGRRIEHLLFVLRLKTRFWRFPTAGMLRRSYRRWRLPTIPMVRKAGESDKDWSYRRRAERTTYVVSTPQDALDSLGSGPSSYMAFRCQDGAVSPAISCIDSRHVLPFAALLKCPTIAGALPSLLGDQKVQFYELGGSIYGQATWLALAFTGWTVNCIDFHCEMPYWLEHGDEPWKRARRSFCPAGRQGVMTQTDATTYPNYPKTGVLVVSMTRMLDWPTMWKALDRVAECRAPGQLTVVSMAGWGGPDRRMLDGLAERAGAWTVLAEDPANASLLLKSNTPAGE